MSDVATASTPPATERAPLALRMAACIFRNTPYFKGKWRAVNYIFHRFQKHSRAVEVVPLRCGVRVRCRLWDEVPNNIWWLGDSCELGEALFFRRCLKPGMTVFDVGANIGYYSLLASPIVGASGKIYSFEPVASTHQELAANIYLNGIGNIRAFRHIVSDHSGPMTMRHGPPDNSGASHVEDGAAGQPDAEQVEAVSLDDFVKRENIRKVDVIKVDVEGYEAAVVKGARQVIEQFKPIWLIEVCTYVIVRYFKGREELYALLDEYGYQPYAISHSGQLRRLTTPEDGKLIAFLPPGMKLPTDE